jgi:hypothetical protein
VFAQEHGHSHQDIIVAYDTLLSHGLRKVSVAQIIAILNHEEISDDVYIMTTSGGGHAYQIEEQASNTLESITQLINQSNRMSYADTQRNTAN